MPLVNLSDVLIPAQKGSYGVAAFDVVNTEYASAIVTAAEQERSPLILMILEGYLRYFDLELLTASLLKLARRSSVPVAVHLDHATSWETIVKAVKLGCTSVMLDCSAAPYQDNVAGTREVVRLCRPLNVSVESEIGSVRGDEAIGAMDLVSSEVDEQYFTDIAQAEQFARDTQVDALAISVGNTHGLYQATPRLDLSRIEQIASRTRVPLVLHGGSGLSDGDFQNAIKRGMCKVNVNTFLVLTAGKHLKDLHTENPEGFNYPEMLLSAHQAVQEQAKCLMRVFGCSHKV